MICNYFLAHPFRKRIWPSQFSGHFLGALISLTLIQGLLATTSTASSFEKPGERCSTSHRISVVKGINYSCEKIKGKLVWKPLFKSSILVPIATPTTTPFPVIAPLPTVTPMTTPLPTAPPGPTAAELALSAGRQALEQAKKAQEEATYQYCVALQQLPINAAKMAGTPVPIPTNDCGPNPTLTTTGP